jgi:putative transposase
MQEFDFDTHHVVVVLAALVRAIVTASAAVELTLWRAITKGEVEARRKTFIRKWRLKCRAVADSLEEAGNKLFTFTRFPPSQWKSIRTSNAIERLHEEFKRRIKTQTVLPCAETAAMLFWALLASGQITMRKVDGWQSLAEKPDDQIIDLAA